MSWVAAAVAGSAIVGGAVSANSANKARGAQSDAENRALAASQSAAGADQVGAAASMRIRDLLGLPGNAYRGKTFNEINADIATLGATRDRNARLYGAADPVFDREINSARLAQQEQPGEFGSLNKQFTIGDFHKDPIVQLEGEFGLNEGRRALEQTASASGMRHSGQALKALTKFGQDYAGSKAGQSASRFYGDQDRIFNRLAGVSGATQAATAQTAAQAPATYGNVIMSGGNARGAASIAQGNAWNGAFNNIGNWWNQQNMMKQLNSGGGPTSNFYYTGNTAAGGNQYG